MTNVIFNTISSIANIERNSKSYSLLLTFAVYKTYICIRDSCWSAMICDFLTVDFDYEVDIALIHIFLMHGRVFFISRLERVIFVMNNWACLYLNSGWNKCNISWAIQFELGKHRSKTIYEQFKEESLLQTALSIKLKRGKNIILSSYI